MSDRTPAGEKGTADRIEADDGGYWVRLVTKQAMRREGECMQNCLRHGSYELLAGEEDMLPETLGSTLWSIRKQCGTSYALAQVDCYGSAKIWRLSEMLGPGNTIPPKWAVRQVRHLRDAYRTTSADLRVDDGIALFDLDGMSHRTDVAPVELRELAERRNGSDWGPRSPRQRGENIRFFRRGYGVLWDDLVSEQAAERAEYERLGIVAPHGTSLTIGVDTQQAPPTRSIMSVSLDGGMLGALMSDGEVVPLAYFIDLPEGTTVTNHLDFHQTLMVTLSTGDVHEVPPPAPRPVFSIGLNTPIRMRPMSVTAFQDAIDRIAGSPLRHPGDR